MLNLTMRHLERSLEHNESFSMTHIDSNDIFQAMRQQEHTDYKCFDYLLRREVKNGTNLEEDEVIDDSCRQRMCDWSYRIVDHFNGNRDLVFSSFNLLNRFLDKCSCDRTAFKLAAMTTLYLSIKINCRKPVTIETFANLSRNEFQVEHIQEMEGIILQALCWRVNPPTAASFIHLLHVQLPSRIKSSVKQTILQRSCFFSEISLFDYFFVTQKSSTIALASITNALEGIDSKILSPLVKEEFITSMTDLVGCDRVLLQTCRQRLWDLYSQSAQFQQHDLKFLVSREIQDSSDKNTFHKEFHNMSTTSSPICVSSFGHKDDQYEDD